MLSFNRYKKMADALNATGRPMLYSMCNWGEDQPWNWAQTVANSWRMTGDVQDTFDRPDKACPCEENEGLDCKLPGFKCSLMNIINKMPMLSQKAGTGSWNDMDILGAFLSLLTESTLMFIYIAEVGNGGMTDEEYVTHFSMWAILKSPLLMGNNFATITPKVYSILSNVPILAVSQDPGASSAVRRWRYYVDDTDEFGQGEIQLWTTSLSGGDMLVALLNAGDNEREMNATLTDIFWGNAPIGNAPQQSQAWDVYDLWGNRMDDGTAMQIITAANQTVNGTGTTVDPNSIGTQFRYNATAMAGYEEGLNQGLEVLLGKKIGTIQPQGTLTATIPRHGVGVYRLRSSSPLVVQNSV